MTERSYNLLSGIYFESRFENLCLNFKVLISDVFSFIYSLFFKSITNLAERLHKVVCHVVALSIPSYYLWIISLSW